MRFSTFGLFVAFVTTGSSAFAGCVVPMPGAGIAGPAALAAAIGAVVGVKYLRARNK